MTAVALVVAGIILALTGVTRAETEPPMTLETAEFMKDIKDECRNATGDDRAFRELVFTMSSETPRCFMAHVNISYMQTPIDGLSKAEQDTLLGGICQQLENAAVCIEPVVDAIKPCMDDEDDMKILMKIVDTVPDAIEMICDNHGAILLELREPLSRSCAVELAPAIDECMDVISNSTMMMDLKDYSATECNEIYAMRDCLDRKIRDCGALTYLELFKLFYRNLLSITPCKE
ncbi:uncharacterized protein LOC134214414 [Armigeres subalbatus]|uniref:uncharacterized protein LOC134214414 n=1 Tax=Armigeres subalbatus TaxID=124917 RepID=UPI002ED121CE